MATFHGAASDRARGLAPDRQHVPVQLSDIAAAPPHHQGRRSDLAPSQVIGFVGVVLGAGNAVGGYVVTERMLQMFKSSGQKKKESA